MSMHKVKPTLPPEEAASGLLPALISWNVTRQCNLTCAHCYRDARERPDPEELSIREGVALIEDIARAGFRVLVLSGGDAVMRSDLCELTGAGGLIIALGPRQWPPPRFASLGHGATKYTTVLPTARPPATRPARPASP